MRKHQFDDPTKQAHFEQILQAQWQHATYHILNFPFDETPNIHSYGIVQNSVKMIEQASDTTDISIGGVFLGTAEVTITKDVEEPVEGFIGKKCNITTWFYDPFDPKWEQSEDYPIPIYSQLYEITDSTETDNGRVLKMTGIMSLFDKALPLSYNPSGSLFTILTKICEKCGVSFCMTQQEVEALPNGTEVWGYYPENDCTTYRDVLHWISQAVCGFCYIAYKEGIGWGLKVASYATQADTDTFDIENRVQGGKLATYATQITAATFTNADGTIQTIGSPVLGRTYDCGFNPFLIYGLQSTVNRMRQAIFDTLYTMRFKPFEVKTIRPPIYDLGDRLFFTNGHMESNGYQSCIQYIEIAQDTLTLKGFGQNPKIASKSSSSRAVSQATKASEMVIKRYNNYNRINVGSSEVICTQIDFSALRGGVEVEMWEEFLCDVNITSSPMTVTAYYYLDGVLLDRRPIETFTDSGEHILDLHYSETIQEAGLHRWIVKLKCDGGTISFDENDVLAVLKGQGLEKEGSWSGLIVVSDIIPMYELPMILNQLSDTTNVTLQDFARRILTENIPIYEQQNQIATISDNARVTWRYGDHILRCGLDNRCGGGRMFGQPTI